MEFGYKKLDAKSFEKRTVDADDFEGLFDLVLRCKAGRSGVVNLVLVAQNALMPSLNYELEPLSWLCFLRSL